MPKKFKVFFSWQADLPSNQTKRFIEESIEAARGILSESITLIPDEATRNRFGTPDIMSSIFEKIDECDLFIADVSIVGKYKPPKSAEDEEPENKYFPNPNVLLELGYASGKVTWERCICLANTKFGDVTNLPFDLNHRRITGFSYESSSRKEEINRIAGIIASTVSEYSGKPLPKRDFSLHMVGGFNLETGTIESCIIPYNQHTFDAYISHNKRILDEITTLINKISAIHLPPKADPKDELKVDFDSRTQNMTLGDIMKDPELYREFSQRVNNFHDAKIDRKYILEKLKKYLKTKLCDDFFDVGGLQESSLNLSRSAPTLEGTDMEKEKYRYIQDLEDNLIELDLREMFLHVFDDVYIIPLAIKNTSTKNDERISINIKVIQGIPIHPTSNFFNPDYTGCEGLVYDKHLIQELLQLPESSKIKLDSSFSAEAIEPYVPQFHMPHLDAFGYATSPASNAEDYEQELQDYVQEISEGTDDEYYFTIGALRPNETLWLDKVLLIKPIDGKIHIDYSIKSNNSTGDLTGTLSL